MNQIGKNFNSNFAGKFLYHHTQGTSDKFITLKMNYGNNVKIMGIMFIILRVIIKSFLICFFLILVQRHGVII